MVWTQVSGERLAYPSRSQTWEVLGEGGRYLSQTNYIIISESEAQVLVFLKLPGDYG